MSVVHVYEPPHTEYRDKPHHTPRELRKPSGPKHQDAIEHLIVSVAGFVTIVLFCLFT